MDVQKTGNLIAAVRKEQNHTQKDLTNDLGVSSAAVSKWERVNRIIVKITTNQSLAEEM